MNLELVNNINNEIDLNKEKSAFGKIISNTIDKASDYVLKAMPIQENIKDVLFDIKEAVKTQDLKGVVTTAISSSIREGLEFLNIPQSSIKNLEQIKDAMLKGGLREALTATLEIAYNKYIKGNMFGEYIKEFIENIKNFINGKGFTNKLSDGVKKLTNKQKSISTLCDQWYKAYEELDITSINSINNKINSQKNTTVLNDSLKKSISVINNMTEFVKTKNEKLSPVQLEFCQNV